MIDSLNHLRLCVIHSHLYENLLSFNLLGVPTGCKRSVKTMILPGDKSLSYRFIYCHTQRPAVPAHLAFALYSRELQIENTR